MSRIPAVPCNNTIAINSSYRYTRLSSFQFLESPFLSHSQTHLLQDPSASFLSNVLTMLRDNPSSSLHCELYHKLPPFVKNKISHCHLRFKSALNTTMHSCIKTVRFYPKPVGVRFIEPVHRPVAMHFSGRVNPT